MSRRCRVCGHEAGRLDDGDGYAYACSRGCGSYWIAPQLTRAVLHPYVQRLVPAMRALREAGEPRVELRSVTDVERVLSSAEALVAR